MNNEIITSKHKKTFDLNPISPEIIIDDSQSISDEEKNNKSSHSQDFQSEYKRDSEFSSTKKHNSTFNSHEKKKKKIMIETKKTFKTSSSRSKYTKKKSKKMSNLKKNISNSSNLVGVIKLIKEFKSNLQYSVYYKKYENLSDKHYEIINDFTNYYDNSAINLKLSSYNMKSIPKQMARYFSSRILIIIYSFGRIISNFFLKLNKLYNENLPVINPDNKFMFYWNIINMILISSVFLLIPLECSFDSLMPEILRSSIDILILGSGIIFIIDIILKLHQGYYDETGEKVMIRKNILISYLKTYVIYDLLFLLSYHKYFESAHSHSYFGFFVFFKFTHLSKIIHSIEEKFSFNDFFEGIFLLIKLVLKIVFIAHIIACFFHIVGTMTYENNEKSWIMLLNQSKLNQWEYRYIYSIYWAVATVITVGYGDITPQNQYEVIFSIFIILIGCGTFAYGINSVGNILSSMSIKEKNYSKELRILNRFMNRNELNNDLQCRVRKYFQYIKSEENSDDIEKENNIIAKLSLGLQNEIILNTNGYILKKMKFFSINFSEDFLRKLVNKLKKKRFLPEEQIFIENDQEAENYFYFIKKGQVEIYVNCYKDGKHTKLCTLDHGKTFNEVSFVLDTPTPYCAKSLNYTTVFYINRKEFINLLKEFPYDYEKFCMIRDQIIFSNNYQDLKITCQLCNKNNHFINECPSITVIKNNWKTLKIYQDSYKYIELKRGNQIIRKNRFKSNNNALVSRKEIDSKAKNFLFKISPFAYTLNETYTMNQETAEIIPNHSIKDYHTIEDNSFDRGPSNLSFKQILNDDSNIINQIIDHHHNNTFNSNNEEVKEVVSNPDIARNQYEITSELDKKSYNSSINNKFIQDKKFFENLFVFSYDHFNCFNCYHPDYNYDRVIFKIRKKYKNYNDKIVIIQSPIPDSIKKGILHKKTNPVRRSFFKEEDAIKSLFSSSSPLNSKLK